MPDKIMMAILNRLQHEVKRYGGKGEIDSTVTLKGISDDSVVIQLEQANKTTTGVFIAAMEAVRVCFEKYVKVFAHMSKLKTVLVRKELKRLTIQGKLKRAE